MLKKLQATYIVNETEEMMYVFYTSSTFYLLMIYIFKLIYFCTKSIDIRSNMSQTNLSNTFVEKLLNICIYISLDVCVHMKLEMYNVNLVRSKFLSRI